MSYPLIQPEHFTNPFFSLLDETFSQHHGIFLDKGNSLFDTLAPITATQASIPVGGRCASLAAQVAHVIFYLEVLERYVVYQDASPADWGEVWRTIEKVSPQEWDALRERLKLAYARIENLFRSNSAWNEDSIGGAMAIVVHSAYHLGEIRQALCVLADVRE